MMASVMNAAAAARTRAANRHGERRHETGERLARRQQQLGLEHVARSRLAEKRVAHPLDDASGRRKIDRDFVGEAFVRHAPTIGARSHDVKIVLVCAHVYGRPRMPAVRRHDAAEGVERDLVHARQPQADDEESAGVDLPGLR